MAAWDPGTTGAQEVAPRIQLRCWGDFTLVDAATGADLKPRGRKARALLAYLALHRGKPISRERLTGLLWGDRAEEQARASLRQAILELKPINNASEEALEIERDHLAIGTGAFLTDIDEMHAANESGDFARLLELLPDRDDRLFANLDGIDEAFDNWLAIERSRQHEALITLIADASAAALAQGQTRLARAFHGRLRELDPDHGSLAELPRSSHAEAAASVAGSSHRPAVGVISPFRRFAPWGTLALAILAAVFGAWFLSREAHQPSATIAVLPFESLPAENAAFAEGLSEEITAQLARQRGLRVAGRTSAAQFKANTADIAAIGRKLGVNYLLEGSVRSVDGRVRVNVSLAKTADGMQLWAETFDGSLDDVLNIQYRIGARVAQALDLRLAGRSRPTGSMATSGQVYSLYLSARGLIRERNPNAFYAAQAKLVEAVKLDPNFAPAWSSLAQTENPGGAGPNLRGRTLQAIGHAERALALAPDLAEAHGVLGMLYGFRHPVGQQHIERAAALDPNNAEFQYWLGAASGEAWDFRRMMDAYRRAYALDPLWNYAAEALVKNAWAMGVRDEALATTRRVEADGSMSQAFLIRAALANARGDFSEEVAQLAKARDSASDPGRKAFAEMALAFAFEKLGLPSQAQEAYRRSGIPETVEPEGRFSTRLPTQAELKRRDRNILYSFDDLAYVGRSAKLLINAGRAREVTDLYDGDGILSLKRGATPGRPAQLLQDGPVVAAALRAAGRGDEADRLLLLLDQRLVAAIRRSDGRVPAGFLALAAQTWALRGKTDAALSALERAVANGWLNASDLADSALPDIGDEPAFRSLRGQPRFEAVRARINGAFAAERREVLAQLAH